MAVSFSNNPIAPPITSTGTGERGTELSKEDMIDFLKDDSSDSPKEPERDNITLTEDKDEDDEEESKEKERVRAKSDKESQEDKDESEEDEIELKEGDEESEEKIELKDDEEELDKEEELIVPIKRKEILKKYPTLFKEFPYLERAYYKSQKFTELFPSIEDAESSLEKASLLDKFSSQLNEGNTENLLQSIKQSDGSAFNKVVDNYLPTLAKVDQGAYYHVLGNVIKGTIKSMVEEARSSQNEALEQAAQIINQFVFGTSKFQPITQLSSPTNQTNPEIEKFNQEKKAWINQRFETSRDELSTRVNNTLKSTINDHIDPKGMMSDYVKKNAIRDTLEGVTKSLDGDTQFRGMVDRLWEKAFKENFSKTTVDKIRLAYLSKAKTLLPEMIRKNRNEALKGIDKRTNDNSDRRGPIPVGRSAAQSSTRSTKTPELKEGMSSLDYLLQD